MLHGLAVGGRVALPVRDCDTVGSGDIFSAVVVGLVHRRVRGVDVLAVGKDSLKGKVRDRGRYLEAEFDSDVTLVYS